MMKVQITGANGFIGSNLTQLLKAEIIPLSITSNNSYIINADIFIHLAGIAHNLNESISSKDYFAINTELTIKAFDAFLSSNAEKFILISSVKAINNESDSTITEETIEQPTTDYGRSKLAADKYIFSNKLPPGKSIYILRPALVTGPGVKGNMRKLFNFSNSSLNWLFSSINNKRSFCNIFNLSYVIQQLIERSDIPSGIYLLSDNETLSTAEIVKELSTREIDNRNLSLIAASFFNLILSLDKRIGYTSLLKPLRILTNNYIVSNTKLTSVLGNSLPFSSIDGIRSIKHIE
jgi:nucleoside-diphosphate-sugar epimerase